MALRSRSGFRTSSAPSQRRKTSWAIGPNTGAAGEGQQISASSTVLATTGSQFGSDGLTMIRTRGELLLVLTAATAAQDGFHGAFGLGLVTAQAFTAGAASLPSPLDEKDWDGWYYHRFYSCIAGGTVAGATTSSQRNQVNATAAAIRIEVDSKAMRKGSTDMITFAALQSVEIGGATMRFMYNSRELIKLP